MRFRDWDNNEYVKRLIESYGEEYTNYFKSEDALNINLEQAKTYFEKLKALKEFYNSNSQLILNTFNESKLKWLNVYPTDWLDIFTHIEYQAWASIRGMGGIVLYPQFPVDKYFIDFANPGLKIGLEIDGKEFHDTEKDKTRDFELSLLGWKIYRITGREMYRTDFTTLNEIDSANDTEAEIYDKLKYWLLETGDGVIHAIKKVYFNIDLKVEEYEVEQENVFIDQAWNNIMEDYQKLCIRTLELHKLV